MDVDQPEQMDVLMENIEAHIGEVYPDVLGYSSKFQLGPGSTGKIQARISGPDPQVLRELADNVRVIFSEQPNTKAIRTDWRQQVKVVRPLLAELPAR